MVDSVVDHNGIERKLGLIPPDEAALQLRASCQSFEDMCGSKGIDIIPMSKWENVDADFGPEFVNDQHNCSGCVGWSAAGAEMKMRAMRGMPFEDLSGAFIYSNINGGQDAGAMITHSMTALERFGVCSRSLFDYPKLYSWQVPQAAKDDAATRKAVVKFPINTIEGLYTSVKLRLPPQYGVFVGRNFNSIDSDGVVGADGGGWANHSVHGCRFRKINGTWCVSVDNSWGKWGIKGMGWAWIPVKRVFLNDAYTHGDSQWVGN